MFVHMSALSVQHPKCAKQFLTGTTAKWVNAYDRKGLLNGEEKNVC